MAGWGEINKWAYKAATGGTTAKGFGQQGTFTKFVGKTLNAATEGLSTYIEDKATEFDNMAKEAWSNSTGEMIDEDWKMRYDQAMTLRQDYVLGNARRRAEIMRELEKLTVEQDNHDTTKIDVVEGALGTNGLNNNYKATNQGHDLIGITNGNTPITYNEETNEPGYILSNEDNLENFEIAKDTFLSHNNLPLNAMEDWGLYDENNEQGQEARKRIIEFYKTFTLAEGEKTREELDNMFGEKWYSRTDVNNIIKEQSTDVVSRDLIAKKIQGDKSKSLSITQGLGEFPYDSIYADTENTIVGLDSANKRSLGMDELLPGTGRTWFKDMQEALMNSTYEELGIPLTKEEAKSLDPTPWNAITPADARVITRAIMRDQDLYTEFLTAYYTGIRKQAWDTAIPERKNWNPTPYNIGKENKPNVTVAGGNMVNGVFVPDEK